MGIAREGGREELLDDERVGRGGGVQAAVPAAACRQAAITASDNVGRTQKLFMLSILGQVSNRNGLGKASNESRGSVRVLALCPWKIVPMAVRRVVLGVASHCRRVYCATHTRTAQPSE